MSNRTLANGFSDLVVPVCNGGTNDTNTLSLAFDGVDQGAKGTIETTEAAGALTAWVRVNDASRAGTFRLRPTASGYRALPAALTIDGVTVQPAIRLEAENANLTAWTDTVNSVAYALTGTGSDPTIDEQSPGIDCKRVKFGGAKYYTGGSALALGSNDIVVEAIVRASNLAGGEYVVAGDSATAPGFMIYHAAAASALTLYMRDATPTTAQVSTPTLVDGAWYHLIWFIDESGNGRCYANAAAGTAVAVSAVGSISTSNLFAIGANGAGASPSSASISYFSLWRRASWLSFADYAGIAAKRFAQCCGVYAGTAQEVNPGFADLDFEAVGTTSWTAVSGATLSKQAGTRTGGSGSQVLRIAGNGVSVPSRATQTVAGKIAGIKGWARSDGTAIPQVRISGALPAVWTGTNSTDWQYFDVDVADNLFAYDQLNLGITTATLSYVEFDDITIEVNGAIPTAQSRTTIANLEKWNTAGTEAYIVPVGANWVRTDKIKCADGTLETGARIENGQTNRLLYSEDFSNGAWTKTRATLGTPVVALGSLSFDAIIASADNDTHLVSQAVTTAASENHSFSIYAKAGAVNSIRIELGEDATQYAYYNLATGATGDTGAGFTLSQPAHMYDKGGGYYRCEFRPTTAGITGTIKVYASDGSTVGSETFTGDGTTTSVYLSGAQFERYVSATQQSGSLTSYIKTTSATATRVKDTLTYHGYENCGGKTSKNITAVIDYVCPVFVSGYTGFRGFGALTAKTANDRMELYRADSTNKAVALVNVGGVSQALLSSATAPPLDGDRQTIEVCFAKDNVNVVITRAVDATDALANIPELLEIVVGSSTAYASQLDGIITDFQLSPYGTVYPRAILALEKDSHTQSAFVGYDALDTDAGTYELRAGAGTTRGVTLNGGILAHDSWHLISLEWSGGTAVSLVVDGIEVDSSTADATIAGLTDLLVAWVGLKGYSYEPSGGALSYPITFGAVSIADVQLHSAAPPAAWYTEMIARGVPAKNEHLIHYISQVAHEAATHYDLLTGTEGTRTDEDEDDYVPPTEVGLALGAPATNNTIIDFGSGFQFMGETSHSYDGWIRVDGSGDQCIWANGDENSTDFQGLLYDDATNSLVYTCVLGVTPVSVSAEIEIGRLYHVAVTRDYDSGSGSTTIRIYIDGEQVEAQLYFLAGAPVVTNDDFVMLSSSESGGVFTRPFIGATVGNRFYDDALTGIEVEAIYDADSEVILNGPYATQEITPATLPATISGAVKPDGVSGYPFVLVQAEAGGSWRAIAKAEGETEYSPFSEQTTVNDFRLYTKSFNSYTESTSYFDDLDGGEDPGASTIGLVEIAKNKRKALENLVLMRKPLHSWAVMVIRYV